MIDENTNSTPEVKTESAPATTTSETYEAPKVEKASRTKSEAEPRQLAKSIRASLKEKIEGNMADIKPALSTETKKAESPKTFTQSSPSASQVTNKVEPVIAPYNMDEKQAEEFYKLSPDLQNYILKRTYDLRSDYSKKTTELSEREKSFAAREREVSDLLSTVSGVKDDYAKMGVSVPQIVQSAIAWDKAFKTNPQQAAIEFLAAQGLDIQELSKINPHQVQQAPQNPGYLTREEAERLADERFEKKIQQQMQEQSTRNAQNTIQSFISEKPFFKDPSTAEQLEVAMAPIVQGILGGDPSRSLKDALETAYNFVTTSDPRFAERNKLYNARLEAEAAEKEAQKALQASRSISGGPGSGSPSRVPKSVRDNLRMRMNGAL